MSERKLSTDEADLIRKTMMKGAPPEAVELFVKTCDRTGLDPFARQITPREQRFRDKRTKEWRSEWSAITTIDGLRLIAERTGRYAGQEGPEWCGPDGKWRDVWLDSKPPAAARVSVVRSDFDRPLVGTAKWSSFAAMKDGRPMALWAKMPDHMLAKCAEALALRRAFPAELAGLYTAEEMGQADDEDAPATPKASRPTPRPATAGSVAKRVLDEGLVPATVRLGERIAGLADAVAAGELSKADARGRIWAAVVAAPNVEARRAIAKAAADVVLAAGVPREKALEVRNRWVTEAPDDPPSTPDDDPPLTEDEAALAEALEEELGGGRDGAFAP